MPAFGPLIVEWRRSRSIPRRTGLGAMALMAAAFAASIAFAVEHPFARAARAALGLALGFWLYRIPSRA